jgi:uncharacterized membrane protein
MAVRTLFATIFIIGGTLHFVLTRAYVSIMPSYLPAPAMLVWVSGVAEILGGLGLLLPAFRPYAAGGLMLLLVAVAPANINMALHAEHWPKIPVWVLWVRVAGQVPLIWWASLYTRR